jgi:hypothetical protein
MIRRPFLRVALKEEKRDLAIGGSYFQRGSIASLSRQCFSDAKR